MLVLFLFYRVENHFWIAAVLATKTHDDLDTQSICTGVGHFAGWPAITHAVKHCASWMVHSLDRECRGHPATLAFVIAFDVSKPLQSVFLLEQLWKGQWRRRESPSVNLALGLPGSIQWW